MAKKPQEQTNVEQTPDQTQTEPTAKGLVTLTFENGLSPSKEDKDACYKAAESLELVGSAKILSFVVKQGKYTVVVDTLTNPMGIRKVSL